MLILASVISPWLGMRPGVRVSDSVAIQKVRQPELVAERLECDVRRRPFPCPTRHSRLGGAGWRRDVPDSLFDHSEDVEFVLDPDDVAAWTRHRDARPPATIQGEQAIITF